MESFTVLSFANLQKKVINMLTLRKYHSIIFKRAKVRVFCCAEMKADEDIRCVDKIFGM